VKPPKGYVPDPDRPLLTTFTYCGINELSAAPCVCVYWNAVFNGLLDSSDEESSSDEDSDDEDEEDGEWPGEKAGTDDAAAGGSISRSDTLESLPSFPNSPEGRNSRRMSQPDRLRESKARHTLKMAEREKLGAGPEEDRGSMFSLEMPERKDNFALRPSAHRASVVRNSKLNIQSMIQNYQAMIPLDEDGVEDADGSGEDGADLSDSSEHSSDFDYFSDDDDENDENDNERSPGATVEATVATGTNGTTKRVAPGSPRSQIEPADVSSGEVSGNTFTRLPASSHLFPCPPVALRKYMLSVHAHTPSPFLPSFPLLLFLPLPSLSVRTPPPPLLMTTTTT